jgi:hypothetical protein
MIGMCSEISSTDEMHDWVGQLKKSHILRFRSSKFDFLSGDWIVLTFKQNPMDVRTHRTPFILHIFITTYYFTLGVI